MTTAATDPIEDAPTETTDAHALSYGGGACRGGETQLQHPHDPATLERNRAANEEHHTMEAEAAAEAEAVEEDLRKEEEEEVEKRNRMEQPPNHLL